MLASTGSAQWIGTAPNLNLYDPANWAGGTVDFQFIGNQNVGAQGYGGYGWPSAPASTSTLTFSAGTATVTSTLSTINLAVGQAVVGAGTSVSSTLATAFGAGVYSITLNSTAGMQVGDEMVGLGIASGAKITAINGNVVTLDLATTRNSDGNSYSAAAYITQITGPNSFTLNRNTTAASSASAYTLSAVNDPFNIAIPATSPGIVPGDFIYQNTDPANVTFTPDNGASWKFNQPLTRLVVDMGQAGIGRRLTLGSNSRGFTMDFSGSDALFAIDGASATGAAGWDTFSISATLKNVHDLTKTGGGALLFSGAAGQTVAMTGAGTVLGGEIELSNVTANQTVAEVNGATRFDVANHGSTLNLHTLAAGSPLLDLQTPVNLYGGALAAGVKADSVAVGAVSLMTGRNVISAYQSDEVTGTGAHAATHALTLASLTRQDGATVNFFGPNLGSTGAHVLISGSDSNIVGDLVGGGGATATSVSILPWATAQTSGMSSAYTQDWVLGDNTPYGGTDLVTYSSATGFRALTASEYHTGLSGAAATDNVSETTNETVSAAQTINALKMGTTNNLQLSLGDTLTLTSGALLDAGVTASISGVGRISSGSRALIVTSTGALTIGASLTNSMAAGSADAGLILAGTSAGTSTITLSGTNTYGGATVVQGNVVVGNDAALPSTTRLRLDSGGSLTVGAGLFTHIAQVSRLSGTGSVNFTASSQLNIGGGAGTANVVTVNGGGSLAPGDSSGPAQAGTLLLGSSVAGLTFLSGSAFEIDLAGATGSDLISIANSAALLDIEGGTLLVNYLDPAYDPAVGTSWLLTSGFGATAGLASAMTVTDSRGYTYGLSYSGNNLDLTLLGVPEPSAALLLLPALGLLAAVRRRAA